MYDYLNNKEILITGGTGSLGKTLTKNIIKNCKVKGIRIFSRSEYNQWEMRNEINKLISIGEFPKVHISYLIGDIRDLNRLTLAMKGTDIVIHTAAMKQIPACEYNPMEAVLTNIIGTQNVIKAALETKPNKVMLISTDKANQPLNLYGATKMTAEKLFLFANVYTGGRPPLFSCCRYGNVIGSRGSVIPLFKKQMLENKHITITNIRMSRFWISLDRVSQFVLSRMGDMHGAEIYIPKMPSSYITSIIEAINTKYHLTWGDFTHEIIGLREGEKLHEVLINEEESKYTVRFNNYYIITRDLQPDIVPYTYSSNPKDNLLFLGDKGIIELLIEAGEL